MYLNPTDLDLYMDLYQFVLTYIVDKSRLNTLDFISLKIHAWFPGLVWAETRPPSKFHQTLLWSFCVILPRNQNVMS